MNPYPPAVMPSPSHSGFPIVPGIVHASAGGLFQPQGLCTPPFPATSLSTTPNPGLASSLPQTSAQTWPGAMRLSLTDNDHLPTPSTHFCFLSLLHVLFNPFHLMHCMHLSTCCSLPPNQYINFVMDFVFLMVLSPSAWKKGLHRVGAH